MMTELSIFYFIMSSLKAAQYLIDTFKSNQVVSCMKWVKDMRMSLFIQCTLICNNDTIFHLINRWRKYVKAKKKKIFKTVHNMIC